MKFNAQPVCCNGRGFTSASSERLLVAADVRRRIPFVAAEVTRRTSCLKESASSRRRLRALLREDRDASSLIGSQEDAKAGILIFENGARDRHGLPCVR